MARGKFSPEGGLEPKLNLPDAKRIPYKSYTLIGNDQTSLVFMNPSVVVGRHASATQSDDRQSRQVPGYSGEPWPRWWTRSRRPINSGSRQPRLGDISLGNAQKEAAQFANLLQFARSIQRIRLMADFRTGLNLNVVAECGSETDARHLNDALRGLIGFGRLQTPDNQRELLRAYDAILPSYSKQSVTVSANLAQDQLERLSAELQKLNPRRPRQ